MLAKGIKAVLNSKLNDWAKEVLNEEIKNIIKTKTIITGGSIVSLLLNEEVNDYDIYFRDKESVKTIAEYYCGLINSGKGIRGKRATVIEDEDKISIMIKSSVIIINEEVEEVEEVEGEQKTKYDLVYITDNAITLKGDIQLVLRFYGEPEDIHKNYDFVHCTCCYSSWNKELSLPQRALEAIINKELLYTGSLFPLCSIIRTRKFIKRGWSINAGQYVKMALQLQELNLKDFNTFRQQLIGVDSAHFNELVRMIEKDKKETDLDNVYLFDLINKIF